MALAPTANSTHEIIVFPKVIARFLNQ
jgi:hypothetical protein